MNQGIIRWMGSGAMLGSAWFTGAFCADAIRYQDLASPLTWGDHWVGATLLTVGLLGIRRPAERGSLYFQGLFYFTWAVLLPGIGSLFAIGCWWLLRSGVARTDAAHAYVVGVRGFAPGVTVERPTFSGTLSEAFSHADEGIRRGAVMALNTLSPHESLPLLKRLIRDSDEQVRLYAQSLLLRVSEQLEENLERLLEGAKESGDSPKELVDLAENYFEFVYLDLIHREMQKSYLHRAVDLLERALRVDASLTKARLMLLKCFLRLGDTRRARLHLEEIQKTPGHGPLVGVWEMEILYLERQWSRFRECRDRISHENLHPTVRSILGFWA